MLKKISLGLALAVSLGTLFAAPTSSQKTVIRLSPNQETVDITLPANATTGYQWFVTGYNHDLLSLENYRYNPPTSKAMGAGGQAIFTFTIDPRFYDAPQIATVELSYQQPWAPLQNASPTTITLSSTTSQNDSSEWQKYPQADGTELIIQNAAQTANDPNWISLPSTSVSKS